MCRMFWNLGSSTFWNPQGLSRPVMVLLYLPVAPIITGITPFFTFPAHCTAIVMSLYFKIFSASLLITFLSPQIAPSINTHVPASLPQIMLSCLLLGAVLSVCTCTFHNMITLPSWLLSTSFGYMVMPLFTFWFYPYFLAYVKVQYSTHYHISYVLFFANIG